MVSKISAGLLMYRWRDGNLEVFLAHPGGPFWKNRDEGAWTIPKGAVEKDEAPLAAAIREFSEETGLEPPPGPFLELGSVRLKSGKIVQGWAFECKTEPCAKSSVQTFACEWPPRSGKIQHFPEIDECRFFSLDEARSKLNPAQMAFLDRLSQLLEAVS